MSGVHLEAGRRSFPTLTVGAVPGPRVQFVRGMRPALDDPEPGPVSWRLLGGNHRELGRSPRSYASVPEARAAVLALQAELGSAVATVVVVPATRMWTWRLRVGEVAQLVSSRSYQRRRESVSNLTRALDALGAATFVADELVLLSARTGAPRPSLATRLDSTAPDVA